MAINCISSFDNPATTIRQLQSEVEFSGSILNQFSGAFFKFELLEFETIFFNLAIQPNTINGINVAFTLYRKDGSTFTNLGTSISDEFNNNFEYSATPGEYYICITTDFSISYILDAIFTDFPFVSIANGVARGGEYMPPFEFAQPTSFCDSPVFYQIIEGALPNGLTLETDGVISGIPTEQDCEEFATDQPPSFTWFEDDESTEVRKSTGLNYRVVIRAALIDAPSTFADREFFICVHNNWDLDRESFRDSIPNLETPVFEVKGEESWFDVEAAAPTPISHISELPKTLCPIKVNTVDSLTLTEIQELTKQVYIAPEYNDLVFINSDGICEVCEIPDTTTEFTIESIDISYCDPCPENVFISELQVIPESMCPICIETIDIADPVDNYVPGISQICYPDLLNRMMNNKVCVTRHTCDPSVAIYKDSRKVAPNILPKTMCEI